MTTSEWSRIEDLFQRALDVDPDARAAFVDREAGADAELAREVHALLAADARLPAFLAPPSARTLGELAAGASAAGPHRGMRLGAYVLQEEIAAGGMGTVWRAARADAEFERVVAIKFLRSERNPGVVVQRFRLERRTLARLDHPNIARLLDGGATDHGLPYLVMEYVDGRPIDAYCDENRLNVRRRLELFLPVAAAVHEAHRSFVVHRDLKPSNILVTRDGVPKLVDFGIAKILDDEESGSAAPTLTRTGVRPMTPRYASPEQIRGEAITTSSDVYSLGVVLYELLCGTQPYAQAATERDVETAILETEPEKPSVVVRRRAGSDAGSDVSGTRDTTAERLRRELAGDLDTIVMTALRKEPERRYRSAEEFGEDVRRLLAGLPIRARRDTLRYRASKFVGRHKLGTAAGAAACAALVVSVGAFLRSAAVAEARLEQVLRLSNLARLDEYAAEADDLWPAEPDHVPAMNAWLDKARALAENVARHQESLDELRAAGERRGDTYAFVDVETQWQHDKTVELIERLTEFAAPDSGLIAQVEARLAFARDVRRLTIEQHADAWSRARAAIADRTRTPQYDGLVLEPQLGLVPLGPDPDSGLWEFAHLQTGAVPERGPDGRLLMDEDSGIVLVLIPAGTFRMGAVPPSDGLPDSAPNVDPRALEREGPVHEVALDAYFIGKHEVSQGQWKRASGTNAGIIRPGTRHGATLISLLHPVESVSWTECDTVLRRMALCLPTEAQWERAARAGTSTPWWSGLERETLRGAVNVADQSAARAGAPWVEIRDWPDLDDGYVVHAPIDTLRPNPFGLHHVVGNVWEWCADKYGAYDLPVRAGDGLRLVDGPAQQVGRGGSFTKTAAIGRHTNRGPAAPFYRDESIGVRAARPVR